VRADAGNCLLIKEQAQTAEFSFSWRTTSLRTQRPEWPILVLFLLAWCSSTRAQTQTPVFIHEACSGKIAAVALSSLKEGIRSSKKYRSVASLDETSGVALTIYMNCTERGDVGAIAFAFGASKCFGSNNCHVAMDGSTIRSALCDARAAIECGHAIFNAFDDYCSKQVKLPLRLN
jgi:hypothetical protein